MVLEDGGGQRAVGLGRLEHRSGRGHVIEVVQRRVVDLLHRIEQLVAFEADGAVPDEVGVGLFDAAGNGAEVAVAEVPLQEQHLLEPTLLRHLAHAQRHEVHRRKLAGDDGDGLRRLGRRGQRVEHRGRHRLLGVGAERPRRKLLVVLGQARNAEGVVHQRLVVALGHAHGRKNGARGIRADEQVDLVGRYQLLVQRAREVGLGLVVLQHPLDRAPQQAAALVERLHVDLARELVHEPRGRQRPRERQRAAHADGLARGLLRGGGAAREQAGAEGTDSARGRDEGTTINAHFLSPE
jgi:hypothetical protein